mmetsp:Transcript_15178/g.40038  ORF Transcript_15178/g.40038 Transcript_15178/m.40038 type:complete len:99 (-) Transcript_15178:49-345(-)
MTTNNTFGLLFQPGCLPGSPCTDAQAEISCSSFCKMLGLLVPYVLSNPEKAWVLKMLASQIAFLKCLPDPDAFRSFFEPLKSTRTNERKLTCLICLAI